MGKLKFDDVVGVLLSEEARRKSSGAAETSGSALNTYERGRLQKKDGRPRSDSKSRKSRSRPPQNKGGGCWNCEKMGHFKRDCKSLKGKQGDNTEGISKDSANLAEGSDSDALVLSLSTDDESWVIDSGASFHATSQRKLLGGYEKGDFGKVYLGDGEPCTIEGKGSTEVKLNSGTSLGLEDVR